MKSLNKFFKNYQFSLNLVDFKRNKNLAHFLILTISIGVVILYLFSGIVKSTLPILLVLDFVAIISIIKFYKEISIKLMIISFIITILVFISAVLKSGFSFFSYIISISTFLCFIASVILSKKKTGVRISSYQMKNKELIISLVLGVLISIPMAILNIIFLYFSQQQPITFQDPINSILIAIHPALYEEIVYRLLLVNICVFCLYDRVTKREMFIVVLLFGTIPHAFLHVIGTISINPIFSMGKVIILILVFGIIRIIFLWYRDIEMSMGYHWFIDFLRFTAGY